MKPLVDLLYEINDIIEKLEELKEEVKIWGLDQEVDNAIWHLNIVKDEIDSTYGDLKREARRVETDPWEVADPDA